MQVTTDGEAPSSAPINVRADSVTPVSVRVSWEPPPPHSHHGAILGYNIGIRKQE